MKKTTRFVIWICSKFTRKEIEQIIQGLIEVLANRNPEVKPKDDFKERHPSYRNFFVDPEPPLKAPPQKAPKLNWKELLSNYQKEKGHPLLPVFLSFPLSLLLRKVLSISVRAFSNTLRAIFWDILKIISSMLSKVKSFISVSTLTLGKVIVIVSMSVDYLLFVKGFCVYR